MGSTFSVPQQGKSETINLTRKVWDDWEQLDDLGAESGWKYVQEKKGNIG